MGEKQVKDNKKNNEGEKKSDGGGANTIVLKFDMHCEGCAKKVKKSIKKFQGVENVKTDCATNKMVVTGKVDPVQIKERVEEKMKKKVELVSLQQNKSAPPKEGGGGGGGEKKPDDKKPEEKKSEGKSDDKKKSEDNNKKEKEKEKPKEPPVATVQLKTRVHCEGCAHKIKKIVSKCEGVQDVNVDLQKDMITAKGTMNMKELLPYLNTKLKRTVELAPAKKDEGSGGDKKPKEGGGGSEKPKDGGGKSEKPKGSGDEKKGGGSDKKDSGDGGKKPGPSGGDASSSKGINEPRMFEINKMEHNPYNYEQGHTYTYDPRQQDQGYGNQVVDYWNAPDYSHPPQMFSDENPNACSIM